MATNIDFLTEEELKEFRQWALERKEHYERILEKIDTRLSSNLINLQKTETGGMAHTVSLRKSYDNLLVKDLIVAIMKEVGVPLSNLEIRKQIKRRAYRDISGNGVRAQLKKSENIIFKRTGEGKFTKWMLIEQN